MLQKLCQLPFQYFSDPRLIKVLFPSLIAASYNNLQNKIILEQEMSCVLLATFIQVPSALCLVSPVLRANSWDWKVNMRQLYARPPSCFFLSMSVLQEVISKAWSHYRNRVERYMLLPGAFQPKSSFAIDREKTCMGLFNRTPGSFKALAITWVCLLVLLQKITAEEG